MKYVTSEVLEAVKTNDLNKINFLDPFAESSRKAKRNLLIASFVALLIASLDLEIVGFLGLRAESAVLNNDLTQGLVCILVVYFLLAFALNTYVDYQAWMFKKERQLTKPYVGLIRLIESHVRITGEQIKNATDPLRALRDQEADMQFQLHLEERLKSTEGQISSIDQALSTLMEELHPLLEHWEETIRKTRRLDRRMTARLLGLWGLDILLPLVLAFAAITFTYSNVGTIVSKMIG